MYKKIVRGTSLLFAVLMLMSTSTFAMDMRASTRIVSSSAIVKSGTDDNLWVYFSINAVSTMDDIGASKISIQRYSGSRWITESTLTPADVPEMQTSDALWHYATIPYSPKYSGTKTLTSQSVTMQVMDTKTIGYANLYSPISLNDK